MTDDESWLKMMAELEAHNAHIMEAIEYLDIQAARKIGRAIYEGNAVVLPDNDPLMEEWTRWRELYE